MVAVLALYVYMGLSVAVVCIYHTAWAGSTLLIFMKGQCESLMIGIGARETYSHVFFVSIIFEFGCSVLVHTSAIIHQPSYVRTVWG